MRVRLTVAAVVLIALIGGCGQTTSQRARVADYIVRVNAIETALAKPLATVGRTATLFVDARAAAPSSKTAGQERALARGAAQIRA